MKGQAVAEYVIFIGVALLITLTFIALASGETDRISEARHRESVNEEIDRIQTEIIAAALARDGYERTIRVAARNGVPVTIRIEDSWLRGESARYSNSIRIPSVSGSVELTNGLFTIRRIADELVVS